MRESLENKTALVTGGTRGIGRAVVERLRAAGVRTAFTWKESGEAAAVLCGRDPGMLGLQADAGDPEQARGVVARVERELGPLDFLINNAGIAGYGLFQEIPFADHERLLRVNLLGPLAYTYEVLPGMIARRGGVVVNISSVWGRDGAACEAVYSASKGGLESFTGALAREVQGCGVRVHAVAPGFVDTDMNRGFDGEDLAAIRTEMMPEGPLSAGEVADRVLFLLGPGGIPENGRILCLGNRG